MSSSQTHLVPFVPLVQGTNSTSSTNKHRYILEPGSKKHLCPDCNKKTFVRYIDTQTGDQLPGQYGRCDRESKCTYHLNPYLDGYSTAIWEQEKSNRSELPNNWKPQRKKVTPQPTSELVFFDFETFKKTLEPSRYDQNTFIQNLLQGINYPFELQEVTKVIQLYRLGTVANGYRAGANTFPFIDLKGNVRAIQVKQFDEQNHTTETDFLHSIIEKHHTRNNKPLPKWLEAYTKQDKRVSCLFGEHLLSKYHNNPVALVEAPKTAVYGTLYFDLPETPESLIWLAVYNKSSFSFDKLKVLKGRTVFVFPDLSKDGSTFKDWQTKAKEYESQLPGTRFIFSNLLEQLAPEQDRQEGSDIADFLIKHDWRLFRKPVPSPASSNPANYIHNTYRYERAESKIINKSEPYYINTLKGCNKWDSDISTLEDYFIKTEPPKGQCIQFNGYTITDYQLFIDRHLSTIKANNGNNTFIPYLHRLQQLKQVMEINNI